MNVLFKPLIDSVFSILKNVLILLIPFLFVFLISFFVICKINPIFLFTNRNKFIINLEKLIIKPKIFDLMRWLLYDFLTKKERSGKFKEYGFTFFVGRQGQGKTISMVDYIIRMKTKYPNCIVVSNFKCSFSDYIMVDWKDILNVRNGEHGIIFAIDEIHSEYSASSWKDVPENLLSEISQQRKQRVKIIASAQYFCRIAKPLREQAQTVVECRTLFGRLTSCKEYDSVIYANAIESGTNKFKPLSKYSFVQSNTLRNSYDTYEKILRMKKIKFIPRNERGE